MIYERETGDVILISIRIIKIEFTDALFTIYEDSSVSGNYFQIRDKVITVK